MASAGARTSLLKALAFRRAGCLHRPPHLLGTGSQWAGRGPRGAPRFSGMSWTWPWPSAVRPNIASIDRSLLGPGFVNASVGLEGSLKVP